MIRIGPVTIMSSKTRDAYRDLANAAYRVHQHIWFADLTIPMQLAYLKELDAVLSEAISHTPPEDIE